MRALEDIAHRAAAHWGEPRDLRLIAQRENAVFALALKGGRRLALRLHRPGYNAPKDIESELWWTGALAERGFPVPAPVRTLAGAFMLPLDGGQVATALSWVSGSPIGAAGTPLDGSPAEQAATYRALGQLLARLHALSDGLTLPRGFTRRDWNAQGFLGESPLWGRFWEHPSLLPDQARLLAETRERARAALADYDRSHPDRGLIHADALRENVFRTGQGLALIDFDDAGFGYRLFDLAVALSQNLFAPGDAALAEALLDGYHQIRPLRDCDRAALPLFRLLRALASLGWVAGRLDAGSPAMTPYRDRALRMAAAFTG